MEPIPKVGTPAISRAIRAFQQSLLPEEWSNPDYSPSSRRWPQILADDNASHIQCNTIHYLASRNNIDERYAF